MLNNLLQIHLKLPQENGTIQKTLEAVGDLTGNKIADKITKASKCSLKIIQKQMKRKYCEKDIYYQN